MSVYGANGVDPMTRLVAEYDLDRLELIDEMRLSHDPVDLTFSGGPLDGRSITVKLRPDEMTVSGEDGRYVPHITDPIYYWLPK